MPVSLPSFTVAAIDSAAFWPGFSARAKVPIALPFASFGSQADFWAALPWRSSASVATNTLGPNGIGASARPTS